MVASGLIECSESRKRTAFFQRCLVLKSKTSAELARHCTANYQCAMDIAMQNLTFG